MIFGRLNDNITYNIFDCVNISTKKQSNSIFFADQYLLRNYLRAGAEFHAYYRSSIQDCKLQIKHTEYDIRFINRWSRLFWLSTFINGSPFLLILFQTDAFITDQIVVADKTFCQGVRYYLSPIRSPVFGNKRFRGKFIFQWMFSGGKKETSSMKSFNNFSYNFSKFFKVFVENTLEQLLLT